MFRKLPQYRVSAAALGKRLATVIEMEKQAMMSPEQFHDTLLAIYNSAISQDYQPPAGSNHHPGVYEEQRAEVDKSARRSAAAREAARRRKELRQAAADSAKQLSHDAYPHDDNESYNPHQCPTVNKFVDHDRRQEVIDFVKNSLYTPIPINSRFL